MAVAVRRRRDGPVLEALERAGGEVPPGLVPPELLPGAIEWFTAFWEISSDRQVGMGVGPIPATSIIRWIEAHGLQEEADDFRACIRAMDKAYFAEINGSAGGGAEVLARMAAS